MIGSKNILLVIFFIFIIPMISSELPQLEDGNPNLPSLDGAVTSNNTFIFNDTITNNINQFDQSLNTTDSVQFNNLTLTGNLTLGQKITFALGGIIDNIINGLITISVNLNVTNDTTSQTFTLNSTTISDWDEISSNVSINFGANESDTSGPKIPFLLTETGVLKINVESTGDEIWGQVGSEIVNLNGNILNFTGELIVSENSTLKGMINITGVPDGLFTCYIFNPNGGCMVGGNETCNVMFSPDGLSSQELCN